MWRSIALSVLLSFSALSLVPAQSILPDSSFPALPGQNLPKLDGIATRLYRLSTELSREAAELRISLEESRNALLSLKLSLDEAMKLIAARERELLFWKGLAAISAIGCVGGLLYGLSR